jgi:hypothetical protein
MSSGFVPRTVTDIILDSPILKADLTTPGTTELIGVSRGGLRFVPNKTLRNIDFDGKRAAGVGLDRIISVNPVITGSMLQVGEQDLRLLEAGSSGTGLIVTPKPLGQLFVVGDYHKFELVFDRSGGGFVTVTFPFGLVVSYELGSTDANEAEVPITIEARQNLLDASSSSAEVPYTITVTDPV